MGGGGVDHARLFFRFAIYCNYIIFMAINFNTIVNFLSKWNGFLVFLWVTFISGHANTHARREVHLYRDVFRRMGGRVGLQTSKSSISLKVCIWNLWLSCQVRASLCNSLFFTSIFLLFFPFNYIYSMALLYHFPVWLS